VPAGCRAARHMASAGRRPTVDHGEPGHAVQRAAAVLPHLRGGVPTSPGTSCWCSAAA
jgi:hypothetical protein